MVRPSLALALLVAAALAHADPPHARKSASAPVSASAPAAAADPLERLGQRLAEKLGARTGPDGAGTFVLRVPSREAAPSHAAAPQSAATRGAASASRSAAPAPPADLCASGRRQSPIDIREGIKVDLDPLQFGYRPSAFRVVDTGRSVRVQPGAGNTVEVLGRRYELRHIEFHRPAEMRVDGRAFEMDVQLVHQSADGKLAVLALLLERGAAQPVVQTVLNNLPLERGDEVAARAPLDLDALLPRERGYFTFMGSLTAPPCSEGVLWMVMKQPVALSPAQLEIFARLHPTNARALQPLAGRLIKESN